MTPIPVHYVLPFFHPVMGGVETRVKEMGTRLAARGHEVVVHCMDRDLQGQRLPARAEWGPLRIERHTPVFHRGGFLHLFLPRLPRGVVADVNGYPFITADWLRLRPARGVTIIRTSHGAPFPAMTPGAARAVRLYDALLGVPTLKRARRVVVMTANETNWMTARGVPRQRIVEVPSGVDDSAFQPRAPGLARERWGLDRYFLFVGRLYREKGPLDLVEALGRVAKEYPGVGAVFAGPDQGEGSRIVARAAELGLAGRVVLAGPVQEEEKWRLLAGCEALVLPSQWEAQGIVFLEAWAQGKPVVATRVGGVPYLVEDGKSGLLTPLGDIPALAQALDALLRDPARARAMGQAGKARCHAGYRWGPLAERLERVYQDAMDPAGSR